MIKNSAVFEKVCWELPYEEVEQYLKGLRLTKQQWIKLVLELLEWSNIE